MRITHLRIQQKMNETIGRKLGIGPVEDNMIENT